ncbi:hypothetical protein EPK99_20695 [Neorhizobium lilium]|uniref:Uncharacterized protein n=1 Tax=Neorhizobium lilium TaxID=2503024 RepID=A0A3S3SBG7_9HYPH|nr:hypothetical protein [Neorhizobium lilium]RWX76070.1 hypothetical protein EPK99_20695 [Neorhizobium lilium]
MKIDSGLNGYYYQGRAQDIDRKTEDAPQREDAIVSRMADAITGSSTLFSSSLSNALWVMESGQSSATPAHEAVSASMSQDWVENLYQEFN